MVARLACKEMMIDPTEVRVCHTTSGAFRLRKPVAGARVGFRLPAIH